MDNKSLSHLNGNASTILFLFQNTVRKYYTEKSGMMFER